MINNTVAPRRHPAWLKRPIGTAGHKSTVESIISSEQLTTVCNEAKCPNRNECFACGTATFMILGASCTRNCAFCSVHHSVPNAIDFNEPLRIANAVKKMELRYVVITSVTRDDYELGGADVFAQTIAAIRTEQPAVRIEVLTSDFNGRTTALRMVLDAKPDVFGHNLETVPRLYSTIRPLADYDRSLAVLRQSAEAGLITKSGIMVGLGETSDEVRSVFKDVKATGCSILTIGQYLRPSKTQIEVAEFISPEQFTAYETMGYAIGFDHVYSGPFVRSSYHAERVFEQGAHGSNS